MPVAARRDVIRGVAAWGLLALSRSVGAQSTPRMPRIALVSNVLPLVHMSGPDPSDDAVRAFVHSLRDLGLVEGRNVVIERRSAEGRRDRLPGIMRQLVDDGVDVIVTPGPAAGVAARATTTVPIVALVDDPVEAGLADSLARPGRNVTAIVGAPPAIEAKRLQLLLEVVPRMRRLAVIGLPRGSGPYTGTFDAAAGALHVDIVRIDAERPEDLQPAFARVAAERCDALFVVDTPFNYANRRAIADLAARQRVPTLVPNRTHAEAGGLVSYGSDFIDDFRRAAAYAKKILDGTRPADLPAESATRLELVINARTAEAIGLAIPPSIRLRADDIIR